MAKKKDHSAHGGEIKQESEYLLNVENLNTHFTTREGIVKAVRGNTFTLKKGQTLGIVGESGSGKSVTVRSILRIIFPPGEIVEGKVVFNGIDLLDLREHEMNKIRGKEISMVFQEPSAALNPVYTVGEQIEEVLQLHHHLTKKEARGEAIRLLREVGIQAPESRVDDYPHQLSGGMQQRCMIAIALACRPKLLIADEPTTSLDVTVQAQILYLLSNLSKQKEVGLIFITHDIAVVAQIADLIMVMYGGKIMELGKVEQIIEKPKHPYTIELLKAMPTIKVKRGEKLFEIKGQVPNLVDPPPGCPFHPRCQKVMEKCSKEPPAFKTVENEHTVACWLY